MRPSLPRRFCALLGASTILLAATPSTAADGFRWDGSQAQRAVSQGVDAVIVRPLAAARVVVGAALLVPAALLASPGGREGIDGAYEIFIEEPVTYAFVRKLGEF
ncbi:MAG: hypothetical protein CL908_01735 [Deltaproteobacteria bacterium]|jgi:hypothetical protein|nr:hypothetical protein [Deltaproteobacteria bacterium]